MRPHSRGHETIIYLYIIDRGTRLRDSNSCITKRFVRPASKASVIWKTDDLNRDLFASNKFNEKIPSPGIMVKVRQYKPSYHSHPVLPAKPVTAVDPPLLLYPASSSASFSDSSLLSLPKESQPWLTAHDCPKDSLAFFLGLA